MKITTEKRAVIHFCWKAGFNATKMFEMIQNVYSESALQCATVGTKCFQKSKSDS